MLGREETMYPVTLTFLLAPEELPVRIQKTKQSLDGTAQHMHFIL